MLFFPFRQEWTRLLYNIVLWSTKNQSTPLKVQWSIDKCSLPGSYQTIDRYWKLRAIIVVSSHEILIYITLSFTYFSRPSSCVNNWSFLRTWTPSYTVCIINKSFKNCIFFVQSLKMPCQSPSILLDISQISFVYIMISRTWACWSFLENDDFGNITSKLFNDKQGSLTELGKFEDKGFRVVGKGDLKYIYLRSSPLN